MRSFFLFLVFACRANVKPVVITLPNVVPPKLDLGYSACNELPNAPLAPVLPKILGYPDESNTIMVSKTDAKEINRRLQDYFDADAQFQQQLRDCVKQLSTAR